jgi:hypothetical protein
VRLEVGDVRRLAQVLRTHSNNDLVAALERGYFAHASVGLKAYASAHNVTAKSMSESIARNPRLYADLDGLADSILKEAPAIRKGLHELTKLFSKAMFPPIWFVVGHSGPGGVTRQEGALIALERYADSPGDVVPLVLHEIAHFQQAMVQGVETYQRIYGPNRTLLAIALREGTADLIAELTTGRHINPRAARYGEENESALWQQFVAERANADTGDWLFVQPSDGRPPDLGYWMGYRIAHRFFEQATDKQQAILAILGLTDAEAFLKASGYGTGN